MTPAEFATLLALGLFAGALGGLVGVSDLLSLLASWGPCKACPADFNSDGNVGVADILTLLANWGPCP